MNPDQYVSHKSFTRAQLHLRQLAVCKLGVPTRCTISAGPARPEDNKYVLMLEFGLSLMPTGPGAASNLGKQPLDQSMVDLIEAVEQGSPLSRMRFEFALLQDPASASMSKSDTPKFEAVEVSMIPLDPNVSFDRQAPPSAPSEFKAMDKSLIPLDPNVSLDQWKQRSAIPLG